MLTSNQAPTAPNRILQRVATPLLTSDQIHSLIGSEASPCAVCGDCEFLVTHRGDWHCTNCEPSMLSASTGIALHLRLFPTGDGRLVAIPLSEAARHAELRSASEQRQGTLQAVGRDLWASWRSSEGIACYARLNLHDPDKLLAQIEAGETFNPW